MPYHKHTPRRQNQKQTLLHTRRGVCGTDWNDSFVNILSHNPVSLRNLKDNQTRRFPCAQRLALPAAGGTRLARETDKTQNHEQSQFGGVNPAVRVHAVLGSAQSGRLPFRKKIQTLFSCFGLKNRKNKKMPIIDNIHQITVNNPTEYEGPNMGNG
jgi:hypothetical protein